MSTRNVSNSRLAQHRSSAQGVMTWKSYTAKCLPCDVKYDVIMKLETHREDEKWLINTRWGS
jgi:hypothetical protein